MGTHFRQSQASLRAARRAQLFFALGMRICLNQFHVRMQHEGPEAALLHIAACLDDVAVRQRWQTR